MALVLVPKAGEGWLSVSALGQDSPASDAGRHGVRADG
jgi:hypothetical protein